MSVRGVRPLWLAVGLAALLAAIVLAASSRLVRVGADTAPVAAAANGGTAFLLFTSLPIYWSEAPDLAATLHGTAPPHWARVALERKGALVPVDALDRATLDASRLLIIQPRPLAPAENVALDAWVMQGGRLLLFADPRLTAESAFGLGDRRRPQDIVLLSPILARWGLALEFDEDQPPGERAVAIGGQARLPTNLAGSFASVRGGSDDARCIVRSEGLVAECTVGAGRIVAVADAALFEPAGDRADANARTAAFEALLARLD